MTSEIPVSSDTRGLSTRDERAEGTGRHFITFETPSDETLRELHVRVIDGVNSRIPLASVELPQAYPFSGVTVDFESWYSRNHVGNAPYPSREAGYSIKVRAALSEPAQIDEEKAKAMLEVLQASVGRGEYRQLSNGTHRIVIPGQSRSQPGSSQEWQDATTVIDLGIDSLDRGIGHMISLWCKTKDRNLRNIIAERIAVLATEATVDTTSVVVSLESNHVNKSGIDVGRHENLSGWSGNFRPGKAQVLPFFENAGYLLEAASRGLGARNLPPVSIPVEVPAEMKFFNPHTSVSRR